MDFKAEQLENAESPRLFTLLPSVMPGSFLQLLKAEAPMDVIVSGRVMLVKFVQLQNAQSPMLVAPLLITMDVILDLTDSQGAPLVLV